MRAVADRFSNSSKQRATASFQTMLLGVLATLLCCLRPVQCFTTTPTTTPNHHGHKSRYIISSFEFHVHVARRSPKNLGPASTTTALQGTASSSTTTTAAATPEAADYLAVYQTTLTFSPYSKLMELQRGEYETRGSSSSSSRCTDDEAEKEEPTIRVVTVDGRTLRFCVKLYPRGGGHASDYTVLGTRKRKEKSSSSSGFGMSYKVLPFFKKVEEEKVGVYLQYLPNDDDSDDNNDVVDASFALRMIGRQRQNNNNNKKGSIPRFDVEFRSGMRFVATTAETKLKEGRANDFGAHLMQTSRLVDFLGIDTDHDKDENNNDNDPNVKVQVSILVHNPPPDKTALPNSSSARDLQTSGILASLIPRDIRRRVPSSSGLFTVNSSDDDGDDDDAQAQEHDTEQVRVGRTVVPVLSRLSQRPRLFQLGAYPGVEYRIMRIIDPETDRDLFYSRPGADYELKPIYPLVAQLERPWPVRVNERELPKLYTAAMYNTISAIGSLVTAITALATAFVISQAVSLFFIPSHSMDPTLQVGDVLVVDKVTPRFVHSKVGDVVLFHPPQQLRDIVSRSGGRQLGDRDLFVKRVAAVAGDRVTVERSGQVLVNGVPLDPSIRNLCTGPGVESYIQHPGEDIPIRDGEVAVLGDCAKVSIDSRIWGALPTDDIVGRPLIRLWPLDRFGSIPRLPTTSTDTTTGASTTSSPAITGSNI